MPEIAARTEVIAALSRLDLSADAIKLIVGPDDPNNGTTVTKPSAPIAGTAGLVRVFEGEDSGTTDTGRFNLSQGNGNEWATLATAFGWGTVLPARFRAEIVTFGIRTNPANGSQYQLTRYDGTSVALVGPVMTVPGNQVTAVFTVDEVFEAGDALNIWTVEAGATDIVGCVWGRFEA